MSRIQGGGRGLSFEKWPEVDRGIWAALFDNPDRFDGAPAAHLAAASVEKLRTSYAAFLGFITIAFPDRLCLHPAARLDPEVAAAYERRLRATCRDMTVASYLDGLAQALKYICPESDAKWLRKRMRSIARNAVKLQHPYVSSAQLLSAGIRLIDRANPGAAGTRAEKLAQAVTFRDGLMIALLASVPLRRRSFANLAIGKQLIHVGSHWALDIFAKDTKAKKRLEYELSDRLSEYIDLYLLHFRSRFPGAESHRGLWPSSTGGSISEGTIGAIISMRTKSDLGFAVSPHRFRAAAASFIAEIDPENVLVSKDLLGHASFATTQRHYLAARSRVAGRTFADIIELRSREGRSEAKPSQLPSSSKRPQT